MELFERFAENPIIAPADVPPSRAGLVVRCVINPGAFIYNGRVGLMLRVCEQPPQEKGWLATLIRDEHSPDGARTIRVALDDPKLRYDDPRVFFYDGQAYLTTLSHLRLAWSEDDRHFKVEPKPALEGQGIYETYGIEDARVTPLEGRFHLTFTAVSEIGVAVGHASTSDFANFARHGLILPPHNKDCAIFPAKVREKYIAVHRPSGIDIGGHFIWLSTSPDLASWGHHHCIARTRPQSWDSQRVGANAPAILTERGWLQLYHGVDGGSRYRMGALLLDRDDPTRVLARSDTPIMNPISEFEKHGFFPNVVFCNGQTVIGDEVVIYYGGADEYIGAARGSLSAILRTLT